MRVAVLTYRATYGAFATITRNIATGLHENGIGVDVLYLEGPGPSDITGYPPGTRIIQLPGRSRSCWPAIARHLRSQRPGALISLGWILNPSAVLAVLVSRTRTPLILNEQSNLSYKTGVEHRHELRLRILGRLARVLYPRADMVTGASSAIVEDLEKGIGIDPRRVPLMVVSNAVDAGEVVRRSTIPDPDAVVPGDGPVFVNVARHARQKNLQLLLRAFRRYRDEGGTGVLVLVGAGPLTVELQKQAATLGLTDRVVFRGLLQNPFPQLAASTAFVLSSEEEGFGLVLVEAMALGVPVVATDCPGGPAEILNRGGAGLLVPNHDEAALAAALRRIADEPDLRSRLSAAGRERAHSYSPQMVGRRWVEILREAGASTKG
jgi:glycosyltransferase involved in cell wall biosynthesis